MKIKDVVDTIECRKQMVKYFEYLKDGNEEIPEEFAKHVIQKIFTKSSAAASTQALDKITKTLYDKIESKELSKDVAYNAYVIERDLILKHCIILEIEHKHTREESMRLNPDFDESKIIVV